MFKRLKISKWRQFDEVDIEFHERLTVLTGANGAGKTTILNLLNRHFGWNIGFVSTFKHDRKMGILKYFADVWKKLIDDEERRYNQIFIGEILYENQGKSTLGVSKDVSHTYHININSMQSINGLHIPSHRSIYNYQAVSTIPTSPKSRQQVYQEYFSVIQNNYLNNYTNQKPNYIVKETLISLATFGYGNQAVTPNPESLRTFEGFQEVLRTVLPPKLGFRKIVIQMPEVILETDSGDFSIDAVSGGIAAIIDLAWQIFMYQEKAERYVVTLDEPENHLHPEMQRSLLPNLIKAFPNVQFIVATHNPFIVSSVPDSNVYVLDYNEGRKVVSNFLDLVNKAGTSNDILRDVLGVSFVMPIWVENKLEEIVKKYVSAGINESNFDKFREEMKCIGLDKFIPVTMARIVEEGEHND